MIGSSAQRGSFRPRRRPQLRWLRNLFGGLLMGCGASMVPGGNDAFSPHAGPAYLAMVLGIAAIVVLFGRRRATA